MFSTWFLPLYRSKFPSGNTFLQSEEFPFMCYLAVQTFKEKLFLVKNIHFMFTFNDYFHWMWCILGLRSILCLHFECHSTAFWPADFVTDAFSTQEPHIICKVLFFFLLHLNDIFLLWTQVNFWSDAGYCVPYFLKCYVYSSNLC